MQNITSHCVFITPNITSFFAEASLSSKKANMTCRCHTINLATFSAILVRPLLGTIYHRDFSICVLGATVVYANFYNTQLTNIGICFSNYSNNHICEKLEPSQERKGIMTEKKIKGKVRQKYSNLTHIISEV